MEYQLEELLPAAVGLTEKYTSKESSSVTYETARALIRHVEKSRTLIIWKIYVLWSCSNLSDA